MRFGAGRDGSGDVGSDDKRKSRVGVFALGEVVRMKRHGWDPSTFTKPHSVLSCETPDNPPSNLTM